MLKVAIVFIFLPVWVIQCSRYYPPDHPPKQEAGNVQNEGLDTLRLGGTPTAGIISIKGRVRVSGNYCGGAAPSREMMEEVRKPKPMVGYRIGVNPTGDYKTDTDHEEWLSTTNEEGVFELKVYPGEYCLKMGSKTQTNPIIPQSKAGWVEVDADCYAKWLEECDLIFTVNEKGEVGANLDILLYEKCFIEGFDPCSRYVGPKPQ